MISCLVTLYVVGGGSEVVIEVTYALETDGKPTCDVERFVLWLLSAVFD